MPTSRARRKQVRKVIDLVRKNKIPVVFCESTISDRAAKQVARETGARYGGVLYVDSLSAAGGPGADLSRSAEGDGRDHREGLRQMNAAAEAHARRARIQRRWAQAFRCATSP